MFSNSHSISKMSVENLREKMDGNSLDLSLTEMTVVPVDQLVSVGAGIILFSYKYNGLNS